MPYQNTYKGIVYWGYMVKEGRKIVQRRMEQSFEKYGWIEEQQKRF
jgi:hypothetical protein